MRQAGGVNQRRDGEARRAWQRVAVAILLIVGLVWTAAASARAGTMRAWGDSEEGALGDGYEVARDTPVSVFGITNARSVGGGFLYSLALETDGTVWAWGDGRLGQLGDGINGHSDYPVQVSGLSNIIAIAAGYDHGLALKSDGTVWAWGNNSEGELGNGTTTNSSVPVQVSGLSGVTDIAGGDVFSLALKSDGTVWAWGGNGEGELGNGTTTNSSVPVQVSTLTGVAAISAGGINGLAIGSGGTVWERGFNVATEPGNGIPRYNDTPVVVSGLSGVMAVTSGDGFDLALKTDGTVWAWGENSQSELGNGSTTNSAVPVKVSDLSGVTGIAAGGEHSLALKADGTVWTWGHNYNGDLGNGTMYDDNLTPMEVSGLSDITAIAGGFYHSLAVVGESSGPTTTASLSGPAGQNGWYTGPVTVTLSATDPVEPSDQLVTYYSLDGGTQQTYTAPFIVSGDNTRHTLLFFSVNHAGNQGMGQALYIGIDDTAPILSFDTPTPAPNASGWNNSAVTIAYNTGDSGSGMDSSTPASPVHLTTEGRNQMQSVKVTDMAGNSATFTSPAVNIDLTPPATTLSFSGPAGADSSSFTGPVQVKLAATDNLSGVSATYYTLDGGPQQTYMQPFTVPADGKHNIIYWSVDAAGNQESEHTQAALVDTSIPAISITTPANQTSYLLNQLVNAAYTVTDTIDGIASLTGTAPAGSPIDTASVGVKNFTVKATDTAGNSSQSSVSYTVSYGAQLLYDPAIAASPGQPLPISLQLMDAAGANVSSASIGVQAVSITAAGEPASVGTGSGPAFTFDPTIEHTGGYVFNLATSGLPAGELSLNFIAGNDPTVHRAFFTSAGAAATIPSGISMVSVPFPNSGDLAALFGVSLFPDGSADIATYDPLSSQYLLYPHLPGLDGKSGLPGRGYWVLESRPKTVQSTVSANPTPLDVTLSPGWNMIGEPYTASLPVSSLQVELSTTVGGNPANQFLSDSAAVSAGVIGATIWGYNSGAKSYVAADTLAPFAGYWIYVDLVGSGGQPVTLRFTQPGLTVVSAGT